MEEGGFCNFMNSIVVIYLRLWLNECPGLSNFVSRQLPDEIQADSMVAPDAAAVAKISIRYLKVNEESRHSCRVNQQSC